MKCLIYTSPFVGLFLTLGTGPATVAQTYQDPPSLVKIPCSHAQENHSSWVEKLSSPQLNCKLTQLRQIYWGGFYDSTFSPLAASSQEAQQIVQGCTPARSVAMKSGGYSWSSSDVCQHLCSLARNGQWSWATLIVSPCPFILTHRAFS